jgi:hypothetical protein
MAIGKDSGPNRRSGEVAPNEKAARGSRDGLRVRLQTWIAHLHHDPSAEERSAEERRALLLRELNQTVADAPDDVPIRYVIERLNRHWDD